jgi:hypothetical protein
MIQVKLPVVSGQASPREAFEAMKSAGRSGVIVRLGPVNAMAHASVVAAAIHQKIGVLEHVTGLILVPKHGPSARVSRLPARHSLANLHPRMVIPGLREAIISVTNHWKTALESGPSLCFCDTCGKAGSREGATCSEPGCGGTIVCLKY